MKCEDNCNRKITFMSLSVFTTGQQGVLTPQYLCWVFVFASVEVWEAEARAYMSLCEGVNLMTLKYSHSRIALVSWLQCLIPDLQLQLGCLNSLWLVYVSHFADYAGLASCQPRSALFWESWPVKPESTPPYSPMTLYASDSLY